MTNRQLIIWFAVVTGVTAIVTSFQSSVGSSSRNQSDLALPQEKHLRNMRQLTFGGENAEAYFSSDGKKLIFQSSHGDVKCDQIFEMNIDGSGQHMVSTGK